MTGPEHIAIEISNPVEKTADSTLQAHDGNSMDVDVEQQRQEQQPEASPNNTSNYASPTLVAAGTDLERISEESRGDDDEYLDDVVMMDAPQNTSEQAEEQEPTTGRPRGRPSHSGDQTPSESSSSKTTGLKRPTRLPVARIKRIVKQDQDVAAISTPAVYAVAAATELFIQYFTEQALLRARSDKRKRLTYKDFSNSVESIEQLQFLKQLIPPPRKYSELVSRGLAPRPELPKGQTTLDGFTGRQNGESSSSNTHHHEVHLEDEEEHFDDGDIGDDEEHDLEEEEEDDTFLNGGKKLAARPDDDTVSEGEEEEDDEDTRRHDHADEDDENEHSAKNGEGYHAAEDSEEDSDLEASHAADYNEDENSFARDANAGSPSSKSKASYDYSPFNSDADREAIAAKNSASVGAGAPPTKARRPKKHRHLFPNGGGIIFINETEKVARTIKVRESKKQQVKQQESNGDTRDDDVEMTEGSNEREDEPHDEFKGRNTSIVSLKDLIQ